MSPLNISPAALAAIRARISSPKVVTPEPPQSSARLTTPDPMPPTMERIDLEIDPHLSTYLHAIAANPGIHNIRLIGPTGCGKTSIGQWLAQETQRPSLIMDCAVVREPRDWFGYRTIVNSQIQWVDSAFVRTIEAGNAIVILDELNRAPSAVLNGLFGLLDHRRESHVEERGRPVRVGPNTIFMATTNVGAKYIGASPIDSAIRNRFSRVVEVSYLPATQEAALLARRTGITLEQATALSDVAATTRAKSSIIEAISTRELLAVAYDLKHFGEQSMRYTMLSKIEDPAQRTSLATLLAGKFPSIMGFTNPTTFNNKAPF
jgi:Holliday junction resolvasome RuvABC ATP-dependent DNA helicase subunit